MAGSRAARVAGYPLLTDPEVTALAFQCWEQDSPIAQSMEVEQYVYWFSRGYDLRSRLNGAT